MTGVAETMAEAGAPGPATPSARAVSTRAVAVAGLAGVLLSGGAGWGAVPLLVAVTLVQAAAVVGWVLGTGLPGRIGGVLVTGAATVAGDVAVSVWPHSQLSPLLAVLGLAVPALFAVQLTRGVVRTRVVESLSDVTLLLVAVVASTSYLQLFHEFDGPVLVSAATAAAGLAVVVGGVTDLVWSRPRFDPDVPRGLSAVVLGTVVAAAGGALRLRGVVDFTTSRAAVLGAGVGLVTALLVVALTFAQRGSSVRPGRVGLRLRPLPVALMPLMLVAPVSYLLSLSL